MTGPTHPIFAGRGGGGSDGGGAGVGLIRAHLHVVSSHLHVGHPCAATAAA